MAKLMRFHIHRICLILLLLVGTVGCDQVTKAVARDSLTITGPLNYLGGAVTILHAQNSGAFLSLGAGLGTEVRFWIFTVAVSLFLLMACLVLFRKKKLGNANTIGLALIVGGGFGNLIDRVAFGSVTDFLNLGIGSLRTGIFNVADMAIVAGVSILFFCSFRKKKERLAARA